MKIIVSHDVDHLYATEHLFKDLILEKMAIRSVVQLFRKQITFKTFCYRITMLFHRRMNRIEEVMEFDQEHHIPSVFFFGMDNALGMSYSKRKAIPYIEYVMKNGFDVGVHGVEYIDAGKIMKEHDAFKSISQKRDFGVRNHYVRFDDHTFEKMAEAGYLFDSTYYNKKNLEMKAPYKVGNMWEFPLHIMDGYVCEQGKLNEGLENTFAIIQRAAEEGMPYCTILFHDHQFDDRFDPERKAWYIKTIEYCERCGYEFISYHDAINELEQRGSGYE